MNYASFSEAIREGAKLRPQGTFGILEQGRTCAIGAGLDAMGIVNAAMRTQDAADILESIYPYLDSDCDTRCPVADCGDHSTLFNTAFHLNDDHEWTRERIADWLESEEEKLGYITVIESAPETQVPATASAQFANVAL